MGFLRTAAPTLCGVLYAWGVAWRFVHLFVLHRADLYIFSDMYMYVHRAVNLFNPAYVEGPEALIVPPGWHLMLGVLYHWDPSWNLAIGIQFVMSALVPLLIGAIAFEMYGRPVALISLALASVYFPFIDYAGYFLADAPYLFFLLLSLWLLVRSIRVPHTGWAVGLAALAGVALGVTTSLKTVILLPALLVLLHLATAAWRYRWGRLPLVLSLASLTLLVTITPLFVRATRLRGKFTPISTNGPLDVMMGHRGRIRLFHFVDPSRNYRSMFGSPVALQKGYTEELRLPFAPYDVEQMLEEAWVWTRANPWLALQLSAEHVTELFYGSVPWPSSHATPRSSRYRSLDGEWRPRGPTPWRSLSAWFERFYWVLILLPAVVHLVRHRGWLTQLQGPGLADGLLILPLLGLMLIVFFTLAAPRYRIPFDGLMIILAARGYTGGTSRPDGLVPRQTEPPPAAK